MRHQRRVRCHNHNDRAAIFLRKPSICRCRILGNFQAHGHSRNAQILSCAIIDRKSTRLNSSHVSISYAVFCLKKKKKKKMKKQKNKKKKKKNDKQLTKNIKNKDHVVTKVCVQSYDISRDYVV